MENNTKYTTDGKKVVIVGNLNNSEKIVQEIYVTKDGAEIPSGENFVVKNLFDEPVKSWKVKEIESVEKRYNTDRIQMEKEISDLWKKHNKNTLLVKNRIDYLGKVLKIADEKSFKTFVDVLTGNIKYVITLSYGGIDSFCTYEEYNFLYENNLKLLTLFGKCDGSFNYRLHDYHDGSGCNNSKHIEFFTDLESALEYIKSFTFDIKNYNDNFLKICKKYNISLQEDILKEYKKLKIESEKQYFESREKDFEKYKTQHLKNIEDIENL